MSAHLHTTKRDSVTGVTCHGCHGVTPLSASAAKGAAKRDSVTFSRLESRCHAFAHMAGSFSGGGAGGPLSPAFRPWESKSVFGASEFRVSGEAI
jgi:hypothetical protein